MGVRERRHRSAVDKGSVDRRVGGSARTRPAGPRSSARSRTRYRSCRAGRSPRPGRSTHRATAPGNGAVRTSDRSRGRVFQEPADDRAPNARCRPPGSRTSGVAGVSGLDLAGRPVDEVKGRLAGPAHRGHLPGAVQQGVPVEDLAGALHPGGRTQVVDRLLLGRQRRRADLSCRPLVTGWAVSSISSRRPPSAPLATVTRRSPAALPRRPAGSR
jgi:hypothetical protein